MLGWIVAAAAASVTMPVALRDTAAIVREDRIVRIGDVVDPSALPSARRTTLAARVVLRMPGHTRGIAVSRATLAALVRRAAPELTVTVGDGRDLIFVAPDQARPAGADVGTPPPPPPIGKGDALRLVSTAGAVRISRAVTALQDVGGQRIFVRDGDGQVFAVRVGDVRTRGDAR